MKTWQIEDRPGLDALTLTERPDPEIGPGEVLVKMRAASLNFRDLMMAQGTYGAKLKLPLVPLSDGAGEVEAIGSGVSRFRVGERVAGIFFQTWLDGELNKDKAASALGGAIDGVLAERVMFHEDGLVRIPAHLSFEEAATLPCAALTAWNALFEQGELKAGETVLVQGTGGVSLFALQLARLSGARVIVTSSSDEKLKRALSLGASDGINYRTTPDWDKRVWELTDGAGVDCVIEVGGAGTLDKSLRAARIGGRISVIGVLSGGRGEVTTAAILQKNLRLQGIYVGSRTMFEAMNRALELHQLKPIVDRIFEFEQAREAYAYMESGAHFGKICIRIGKC